MASTLAWKLGDWNWSISQGELAAAAALASRGYMPPMLYMTLEDERLNLDLIPPSDLGALASVATLMVGIHSVRGNPSPVLGGLNCHHLTVDMSLSTSSTVALVEAMKRGVEDVTLYRPEDVDMTELVRYGGDGRCRSVTLLGYISDECRLRAKQWASMMGWECQEDDDDSSMKMTRGWVKWMKTVTRAPEKPLPE